MTVFSRLDSWLTALSSDFSAGVISAWLMAASWAVGDRRSLFIACARDRIRGRREVAGIVCHHWRRLLSLRNGRSIWRSRRQRRYRDLVGRGHIRGISHCRLLRLAFYRQRLRAIRIGHHGGWLCGVRHYRIRRIRRGRRRGRESVRDANRDTDWLFSLNNPPVPKISRQDQDREGRDRQKHRREREDLRRGAPAPRPIDVAAIRDDRNSELAGYCLSPFHLGQAVLELPVKCERIARARLWI